MEQKVWLVTGAAGFIGSHLVEKLLMLDQKVVGLDNFSTGSRANLIDVQKIVGNKWSNFKLRIGDITDQAACDGSVQGVNYILHNAALGSVPRSLVTPELYDTNNILGTSNMLNAARKYPVEKFVYASSSSVYGDRTELPFKEDFIGTALSPYAASKQINEIYAKSFSQCYNVKAIGLRYFNVFGRRANKVGPYANVIPKWINAFKTDSDIIINGDGEISRDFCYIDNIVTANILAAKSEYSGNVFNIACGESTSLNDLYNMMRTMYPDSKSKLIYKEARIGDMQNTKACINKLQNELQLKTIISLKDGLKLITDITPYAY